MAERQSADELMRYFRDETVGRRWPSPRAITSRLQHPPPPRHHRKSPPPRTIVRTVLFERPRCKILLANGHRCSELTRQRSKLCSTHLALFAGHICIRNINKKDKYNAKILCQSAYRSLLRSNCMHGAECEYTHDLMCPEWTKCKEKSRDHLKSWYHPTKCTNPRSCPDYGSNHRMSIVHKCIQERSNGSRCDENACKQSYGYICYKHYLDMN